MIEPQWWRTVDWQAMLTWLGERASTRKRRLCACAVARRYWEELADHCRHALGVAERLTDGKADETEVRAARLAIKAATLPSRRAREWLVIDATGVAVGGHPLALTGLGRLGKAPWIADVVRDLFGPLPFRAVAIRPEWLAWNGHSVRGLARAIHDERTYDLMPVLGDALEEAGCADADVLGHCRGSGPHWRGCWVIDALLGKG